MNLSEISMVMKLYIQDGNVVYGNAQNVERYNIAVNLMNKTYDTVH